LDKASSILEINERLIANKRFRNNSMKTGDAFKLRNKYWQGREHYSISQPCMIIPRDSSSSREYIPMGFLPPYSVVNAPNFVIYNAEPWLFAIMESKMHTVWVKTVCGHLKTDFRYSAALGYNSFPFPTLSVEKKQQLETTARGILLAREENYEMTLAQQYDPEKMPSVLRAAHDANDLLVDSLYNPNGFENDEERLNELFKRYTKLVEKEKK
jgi:hypothetical protein